MGLFGAALDRVVLRRVMGCDKHRILRHAAGRRRLDAPQRRLPIQKLVGGAVPS